MEIKVLLLHGLLHLAGYDHESDDGAMRRQEMRLRRELGLSEGLIERARPARSHSEPSRQRSGQDRSGRRTVSA
jgi:probable rRNA maturation factor